MRKIFVVGYEPISKKASVGGFDWFYQQEDANTHFKKEQEADKGSHIIYRGVVELSENVTDADEITQLIDLFLEENNWDKAFCDTPPFEAYDREISGE